ncbi:hypothetical protein MNBD_ALPHA04-2258 [hydrothermal vent metagenome]|uniref:DUF177 domain-containing protein n=1 Tax=hydrothermal vent metagenome TaxID=652676 RepID=A0A3B0SAF5_9ZZZZ
MSGKATPEFSVTIKLSELGSLPSASAISADAEQCAELATRFGLPKISSLKADYRLEAQNDRIVFSGRLQSDLMQICAISGQGFQASIKENFEIIFVEKYEYMVEDDEIELASEDCDVMVYEGGQIDVGEAVAQTLYLALDPYPRGPNAEQIARDKGLKTEEEAGPFGVLAALKDKLG